MPMRYAAILSLCVSLALPARADPVVFPLAEILDLTRLSHLDAAALARALDDMLPLNTTIAPQAPTIGQGDPFLWSLSGDFGPEGGDPRPGAIFNCTRYGLHTRDLFETFGAAAPETFALLDYARPRFDDAAQWPDAAVARLHCSFVWDDAQVVAIMDAPQVRAALTLIGPVTDRTSDAGSTALFGDGGFRLDAVDALGDSVVGRRTARVTLTEGHQSVEIRGFLMGGGV